MTFIAEAIVSKVIEELTTLAIDELNQEVRLVVGVKDQVKELTNNLRAIQDVLIDAEQKQLKDTGIRSWLDELKDISYDIDDVLDEWRSAMIIKSRGRVEANNCLTASSSYTKRKVFSFVPSCCFQFGEIGLRHDISCKIKELNERLDNIAIRRERYGLVRIEVGEQVQQRITISAIDITEVKGRGDEKQKIIVMLLEDTSSKVGPKIVSVVGMGGIGKTTLAQLAYNDSRVKEHFDKRMWVCVSDPFEENKVARAILEALGGSEKSELQTMVQDIKERIGEDKFLLVLDDVWNKDPSKWKNLKTALMCETVGSAIIVTTRDADVAKIMGCVDSKYLFRPGHLTKQECWDIISSEAALTAEKLAGLQDIGSQLAGKCNGLPLAAKALGGLLRFRDTRQQWRSVLESEMWRLGEEVPEFKRVLFVPLSLSYYDLCPAERQCFTYCASYPKDYDFIKHELIRSWMAQGYLKETESIDMQMVGEEYFRNLSARSLFQDFKTGAVGEIYKFKMHDIVHDFLLFISKKECLHVEELNSLHKTRHLRVNRFDKLPNTIISFKKLRTLEVEDIGGVDLQILFKNLICLRSLALVSCGIKEVPSTISNLVHLRLLDLSKNDELRELPEEVGGLCNLLSLFLIRCEIDKMQCMIEKIPNLRYLITDETIIRLTQGMGQLHALREAYFFVDNCADENGDAASLGNLKNMNHLHTVWIKLGRNMGHVDGAKQAQLNEKKRLVNLELKFDEPKEPEENEDKWKLHDEELIEVLEPCTDLERLCISSYLGSKQCPRWLASLNHLTWLELKRWKNCSCLPPLGKLQSLRFLFLSYMKVKKVGLEFLRIESNNHSLSVVAFPKLEKLKLSYLEEWEEWDMDYSDNINIMPRLTNLEIDNCYKLKALPDHLLQKTMLQHLHIRSSDLLFKRYYKGEGGVDCPKISRIPFTKFRWTDRVKVSSENGLQVSHDDGCSWRKYGQEDILGAKYPRGYYRCTYRNTQNCCATKQVQRSDEDPTIFEITYRGTHTCSTSFISPATPEPSYSVSPFQVNDFGGVQNCS